EAAALAYVNQAEAKGAHQLAGKTDHDQQTDLLRIEMPQADDRRQHIGDGDRVEGSEDPCGADDQPHFHMPGAVRQAFKPRHHVAHVAALVQSRDVSHDIPPNFSVWDRSRPADLGMTISSVASPPSLERKTGSALSRRDRSHK